MNPVEEEVGVGAELGESNIGYQDDGQGNHDAPKQIVDAILEGTREAQDQERFYRLSEVMLDSLDRLYDMGIQHVYANRNFCYTQAIPGASYVNQDGEEDSFGDYIGDYNIFTTYGFIIQVKVSEPDIGIDFQPIDPESPDDRTSAAAAEGIRQQCDMDCDPNEVVQKMAYYVEMGGSAMQWTYTDDEIAQFGTGQDGLPRRKIIRDIGGVLEWKRPIFANCLKEYPYAIRYDDLYIHEARTKYKWIASDIKAGSACLNENAYERIARLGVVLPSQSSGFVWNIGDSLSHLISRGNIWLRLSAFEQMTDDFRDGNNPPEMVDDEDRYGAPIQRPKQVREKMAELFPDGVHAVVLGSQYAESWNQSMDDCLREVHAYIGKGQSRRPIMKDMVLVQDAVNQTINYIREKNDFGVPSTYVREEDYDAITKQKARPGAFRPVKDLPPGMSIQDCIYREDENGIPPGFIQLVEFFQTFAQFQLSTPPSVFGEATSDTKVATLYQQSAAQAMGILGKLKSNINSAIADGYYQACLAVSKDDRYPDKLILPVLGGHGQTKTVLKAHLTKGNFRCYPDKDSGFPESTQQTRQAMERFMEMSMNTPAAGQIWSSPNNVAEIVRVSGLKLEVPEADAWSKQSREIDILLRNPPALKSPELVALLRPTSDGGQGAGIVAMSEAIKAAFMQAMGAWKAAQQAQQSQYQAQIAEFEKEYAAQVIAAEAQGLPAPNKPPAPPAPTPLPEPQLSAIAQSSMPVRDSDYHQFEANKCQNWLSSPDEWNEETLGRAIAGGPVQPNIAGVLNVTLHWMEHVMKIPTQPPPPSGPLPAKGSAAKQLPPAAAGA